MKLLTAAAVAALSVVAAPAHAALAPVATGEGNINSVADLETELGIALGTSGLIVAEEVNGCNGTTCTGNSEKDLANDTFTVSLNGNSGSFDYDIPLTHKLSYFTIKGGQSWEIFQMPLPLASSGTNIEFDIANLLKGNGKPGADLSNMFFFASLDTGGDIIDGEVPLPAAAPLFAGALAGFGVYRRRKARRQAR
jgi:hypothetical protein